MLMHHGSRGYEEAASEAAARARTKLEGLIEIGRTSAAAIIDKIRTEVPVDDVVSSRSFRFDGDIDDREIGSPDGLRLLYAPRGADETVLSVHRHALSQICERSVPADERGLPLKYVQWLMEPQRAGWGTQLVAENLNRLYSHRESRDHFLLRSYGSQLRGFLSNRYRRLDSRPLVDAFAGACQEVGAVPVQGYGSDTRVAVKALLPVVFEPVPNEVLAFGAMWENSDYGNGVHSIRVFVLRLICTNYAIADEGLRQVHLGRRLTEDMEWSRQTHQLDTRTTASAIQDIVKGTLNPERIKEFCDVVREASSGDYDVGGSLRHAAKRGTSSTLPGRMRLLTKGELEDVRDTYLEADVERLPPGNSLWRLSNAISWVANKTEDVERKVDLMKIAGSVLPKLRSAA